MAFSSLVSMVALLQIDRIVDGGLLSYGASLNSGLYASYSQMVQLAFVLGWFNIVAAVGVHVYSMAFHRKEVQMLVREAEVEMRRRQVEELRNLDEHPILPGLPEHETLAKSEGVLEREKETIKASA